MCSVSSGTLQKLEDAPPLPLVCPMLPLSLATLWERDLIVLSRDQSSQHQRPAPPMPCQALGRAQPSFT